MLNILIADDDQNMCDCLLQLLDWASLQCNIPQVAHNGREAWKIIRQGNIDLLITDVRMPVIEGGQLCTLIHENALETKTILISAYEDFSVAQQALKDHVIDYIVKPIDRTDLDNIEKIVGRVRQDKELLHKYRQFFDESYTQAVYVAIINRDEQFLSDMFETLNSLGNRDTLGICTNLLRILHRYLSSPTLENSTDVNDALMRKWSAHLLSLTDPRQRISYVQECFQVEMTSMQQETSSESLVRRIRKIVDENYSNADCNVAWVADKLSLTTGYISKQFTKETGQKLVRYIAACRLQAACHLLETENLSIKEIALRVGFLDLEYFIKTFRAEKGMSPSEYRRRVRR